MKRLQISLDHELDEELDRAARTQGVSKAEIVRRCLREGVKPPLPTKDSFDDIFGLFGEDDGPTDMSRNVDYWVYDLEYEKWSSSTRRT